MYLVLGDAGPKYFMDNYPTTALWELRAQKLIALCNECFRKKRNRTLDRHKFFSRLKQPGESLPQFCHTLNGLAALCDFGDKTTTLVLAMFILHMNYKKLKEKLCIEPKEPDQALEFAIAFEKGVKRQKAYGTQVPETAEAVVKSEPIFAIEKTHPRECYRSWEANFIREHVNFCIATNHRCKFCILVGHLESAAKRSFPSGTKK